MGKKTRMEIALELEAAGLGNALEFCEQVTAITTDVLSRDIVNGVVDGMQIIGEMLDGKLLVVMSDAEYMAAKSRLDEIKRPFGERVREYRDKNGVSQTKLANDVGISRNYLSQIEKGKASNISYEIRKRLEEHCFLWI